MFDDDSFVIWLFILAIVISPLLFLARMVLLGLWIYGAYKAQQQAVNANVAALESLARQASARTEWNGLLQAAHHMQSAVDARARQRGTATDVIATQFRTGWTNAQLELNRFDQLSRERADLHLADMKSQAASMGLFI